MSSGYIDSGSFGMLLMTGWSEQGALPDLEPFSMRALSQRRGYPGNARDMSYSLNS